MGDLDKDKSSQGCCMAKLTTLHERRWRSTVCCRQEFHMNDEDRRAERYSAPVAQPGDCGRAAVVGLKRRRR
ncbi:hypothetical protein BHE74_00000663 [Ensete ventricosum]|nr:hypothetical protein GW17_00035661 [Ensete ventricosum]RWW90186.1 hypothetical protein BHE74_00000663 [Ensete ventricosum]